LNKRQSTKVWLGKSWWTVFDLEKRDSLVYKAFGQSVLFQEKENDANWIGFFTLFHLVLITDSYK